MLQLTRYIAGLLLLAQRLNVRNRRPAEGEMRPMTRQSSRFGDTLGYRDQSAKPRRSGQEAQPRAVRQVRRPGPCFDRLDQIAAAAGIAWAARLPLIWLRRLRNRHELARLDEAQLRDVGLNPEVVRREATKPFWKE